jgi:hypothetical protein
MHLAHSALHCHSAHDHPISPRDVGSLVPANEQDETHFCPICDFQATKPFHQSLSALPIETKGPLFSLASFVQPFTAKRCSNPSDPRAPPPFYPES